MCLEEHVEEGGHRHGYGGSVVRTVEQGHEQWHAGDEAGQHGGDEHGAHLYLAVDEVAGLVHFILTSRQSREEVGLNGAEYHGGIGDGHDVAAAIEAHLVRAAPGVEQTADDVVGTRAENARGYEAEAKLHHGHALVPPACAETRAPQGEDAMRIAERGKVDDELAEE